MFFGLSGWLGMSRACLQMFVDCRGDFWRCRGHVCVCRENVVGVSRVRLVVSWGCRGMSWCCRDVVCMFGCGLAMFGDAMGISTGGQKHVAGMFGGVVGCLGMTRAILCMLWECHFDVVTML